MDDIDTEPYAKFFSAADQLVAVGGRATLRAVLERAGSGSMRDVTAAMQQWRARRQPLPEVSSKAPESFHAVVEQLWTDARERAMAHVDEERKGLASATVAAKAEVDEITALAELFETQRNGLATQLADAMRERDSARKSAAELEAQLKAHQAFFEEKLRTVLLKAATRKAPRAEKKAS